MTDNRHSDQLASKHYNQHFNNDTYNGFKTTFQRDLDTDNLTENALTDLMNLLTDAAHEICQHSKYTGACQKLAIQLALCPLLSLEKVVAAAITHLKRFAQIGDTHVEDFEATAKALAITEQLMPLLNEIGILNNGHSSRHRAAAHLTSAAKFLIRTAQILLMQEDLFYAAEKAHRATNDMQSAFEELSKDGEQGQKAFVPFVQECVVNERASGLSGEDVRMLFQWLQGDTEASSDGLVVWDQPRLSQNQAWAVIYYLQEKLHILPAHFQYCSTCQAFRSLKRHNCNR